MGTKINHPLLPTSCILLTATAIVGSKVIIETKLPPKLPNATWAITVAIVVESTKYQYWALVDTPEKSANLIKPSLVASTIGN
jgi:hypothetical protein